jgi:ubiquinol-cytochrome c reductase cytochrome b subunit
VITGIIGVVPLVGHDLASWVWGGSSISQPTLNRFFSLHFVLPFFMILIIIVHLSFLHRKGSSNSLALHSNSDKIKFHPLFSIKDCLPLGFILIVMVMLVSINPYILRDTENFNIANPLVAPTHIQPEWYFLFAYAILRAIPSKLGGVVSLVMSIFILITPALKSPRRAKFLPFQKLNF